MIALENSFKVKSTTDNFLQPLKSNFLHKPFECFSRVRKQPVATFDDGALTFENDNQELARFIEDNYQYFKKQNSNLDLPAGGEGGTLAQLQQACSDSDFLTLKNNVDSVDVAGVDGKKVKSKKHKMSAISDSDFMVSVGRQPSLCRNFTIKSKIPFAKTILQGKLQRPGKYNSLDPQQQTATLAPFCLGEDKENVSNNFSQKGLNSLNNNLSRSLNGCHRRKNEPVPVRNMQRVLSEGNDASASGTGCQQQSQQNQSQFQPPQQQPPTYDAFDMFIKLFNCEKNNKNMCDKQSNKFNYKIVVNSKEFDYSDNVLVNYKSDSCEKIRSLNDPARTSAEGGGATSTSFAPVLSKSSSDQIMLLNPRDENFVYVLNSDINLHNSHVLVNNFVITSPPLTPNLRSPKNVNRDGGGPTMLDATAAASGYLVHSQHLNDVSSLPMDIGTASPLDHLIGIKSDPELLLELKLAPAANGVNGNIVDSSTNFIKNNLALTSNGNQGVVKRDKCGGTRKPSVTYDINVINRSQDFNIDEMCQPHQQRHSYALRSGSTSSTSRFYVYFPFPFHRSYSI